VGIVATDQEDFASDVGSGCRSERPSDVTNIDGLYPAIAW
jgi:hypothetical protein